LYCFVHVTLLFAVCIFVLCLYVLGWYEDNWFEVNLEKEEVGCTKEEMRTAAEGHLTTEAVMWNQNKHQPTISGKVMTDWRLTVGGCG
jgi:hypothetical protein